MNPAMNPVRRPMRGIGDQVSRLALIGGVLASLLVAGLGPAVAGPAVEPQGDGEQHLWYDGAVPRVFTLVEDELGVWLAPGVDELSESRVARSLTEQLPNSTLLDVEGRIARLRLASPLRASNLIESLGARQLDGSSGWVDRVFRAGAHPDAPRYLLTGEMIVHFEAPTDMAAARVWSDTMGVTLRRALGLDQAYLFSCPAGPACLELTRVVRDDPTVRYAYPNWIRPRVQRNDPLYPDQWHLNNTGQGSGTVGADARLEAAWSAGFDGAGVTIAIVDDGLEINHEDLQPNVVAGSWDYIGNDSNPTHTNSWEGHGSACAGVAAGRGFNSLGVRGAAHAANLVGYRLLGAGTDANEADALLRDDAPVAISSNSWGPPDTGQALVAPGPLTQAALASATSSGRDGKGTVFVWAGGNGLENRDNANYDGYANSRHTIAVAASTNQGVQSYYSEPGANILVNAPSNGGTRGITTTDRSGSAGYSSTNYTSSFGGTSSAAPLVAGVVALVLQANPELTWRDVKHLLAKTATKNHPNDADWTTNGAGLPINHKYGFGRVDAGAAVAAAQTWINLGPEQTTADERMPGFAIPDGQGADVCGGWVTDTLMIEDDLIIDSVLVGFRSNHTYWGDLEIRLVSPMGTESILAERHNSGRTAAFANGWTFAVERLIDESSAGEWTLKVRDCYNTDVGTLEQWSVMVHGSTPSSAGLVSATQSTVSAVPSSVLANGASAATINVTLMDAFGDPVSGKSVTLSAVAGNSTIIPSSATSSAAGLASFSVTNTQPETVTYVARGGGVVIEQTAQVTFTPVTHLITTQVSPPGGGAVVCEPSLVSPGAISVCTLTPALGYGIGSVEGCDGKLEGNLYTTGAINGDCRVTVFYRLMSDVNEDGEVDASDVDAIADSILAGSYTPVADVNADGQVDILDQLFVIQWINTAESGPPAP